MKSKDLPEKRFEELSREIELVNKSIQEIIPRAIIKEVSTFGNSSHVVLPKEFIDKKVGIIILQERELKGGLP